MKSFVLSLVLLLAIGIAGSAPASAAISDDARETARRDRAASYQDTGTHLQRQRVARASINDSDDDDWGYRSSRRHYFLREVCGEAPLREAQQRAHGRQAQALRAA